MTVPKALLLVEDDPFLREALEQTLNKVGYRIYTASDGEEGVRIFDVHHSEIDLLVSDVSMPKLSGPNLASHLRKKSPQLKVLFISGDVDESVAFHGVDDKTTFVLAKPFGIKQLVQKVQDILSGD